jgi:hypothetical protein
VFSIRSGDAGRADWIEIDGQPSTAQDVRVIGSVFGMSGDSILRACQKVGANGVERQENAWGLSAEAGCGLSQKAVIIEVTANGPPRRIQRTKFRYRVGLKNYVQRLANGRDARVSFTCVYKLSGPNNHKALSIEIRPSTGGAILGYY